MPRLHLRDQLGAHEVPFAALKQIGYGQPVTWTGTDIKGLSIDARNAYGGPATLGDFTLEIDWIRVD